MKTIEDIEKEYEGFQVKSDFITSLDEFVAFLLVGIDDTLEIEKDNRKEIRYNNIAKIESRIKNAIMFMFDCEEVNILDEDNEILGEISSLTGSYRSMYETMIDIADENNYQELVKLVDFATEYYNQHIDYFESQRDSLEMALRGISMYNPRYHDDRKVINEFINKKLSFYSNKTQLVKKV